jgi:hypothetical protein
MELDGRGVLRPEPLSDGIDPGFQPVCRTFEHSKTSQDEELGAWILRMADSSRYEMQAASEMKTGRDVRPVGMEAGGTIVNAPLSTALPAQTGVLPAPEAAQPQLFARQTTVTGSHGSVVSLSDLRDGKVEP